MSFQTTDGDLALAGFIESNTDIMADFITAMLQIRGPPNSRLFSIMEMVLLTAGGAVVGLLASSSVFVAAILIYRRRQRHKK